MSVDVGVIKTGMLADAARTFLVGNVSENAKRLVGYRRELLVCSQTTLQNQELTSEISVTQFMNMRQVVGNTLYARLHGSRCVGRKLHEAPAVPNVECQRRSPQKWA